MRAAVVVFVRRRLRGEPQILAVTNRAFGGMSLPGGKVDEGESPRQAAVREVYEEVRVHLRHSDLTQLAKGPSARVDSICEVTIFFARAAWGQPRNVERGTVHQWVTLAELLDVSPFAAFYEQHLPDGVSHLVPTIFDGNPP